MPSSALPKLLQLMFSSLRLKDIPIYLNVSSAEGLLRRFHLDATIQSPIGDSLLAVDANIAGDKVNSIITNTLDDQVVIDVNGNVIHHTINRYLWVTQPSVYGGSLPY